MIYGSRIPQSFDVPTLSKRLYTSKWDCENLVTNWLRRRWLRQDRPGHYVKQPRFGKNDTAHLQQEILPRGRWTRRDVMNARLDELIEQHNMRRNKDRRAFWADQIESIQAEITEIRCE
jgi:hypothetical protein